MKEVFAALGWLGAAIAVQAQTAVAATIPRASLINTDRYGMNGDNLHFNASGQQALDNDSAAALFSYVPFRSSPTLKRLGNGDIEVTVIQPFLGFLYTLQNSGALLPGGWSNGDSETATSTAPVVLTYTPGIGETARFFRVGRSPTPYSLGITMEYPNLLVIAVSGFRALHPVRSSGRIQICIRTAKSGL